MNLFTMFTIAMMVLLLAVLVYWYFMNGAPKEAPKEGFQTSKPDWFIASLDPSTMLAYDKEVYYFKLITAFNAGPNRFGLTLTEVQEQLIALRRNMPSVGAKLNDFEPVVLGVSVVDVPISGYSQLYDALFACMSVPQFTGVYYNPTKKEFGLRDASSKGSVPLAGAFYYMKTGNTVAPAPEPATAAPPPPPAEINLGNTGAGASTTINISGTYAAAAEGLLKEYRELARQDYVDTGKSRFNRLADTIHPYNSMFATQMTSEDGTLLNNLNADIQDALKTLELNPVDKTLVGSPTAVRSNTYLASLGTVEERIPKDKIIKRQVRKCQNEFTSSCSSGTCTKEDYARLTTDMCDKIGSDAYPLCGVCLQEKDNTTLNSIGSWFTGLFATVEDASQKDINGNPTPKPSVGSCADGMFFTDKDLCKQKVNQLICEKFGASNPETCMYCIQSKTYVYQTRDANIEYTMTVRMLFPSGTGRNLYTITKSDGTILKQGTVDMATAGSGERIESISYKLTDKFTFSFTQEFPHRPSGLSGNKNKEVFLVTLPAGVDGTTFAKSIDCTVATTNEIQTEFSDPGGDTDIEDTKKNQVWCKGLKPWARAVSVAGLEIHPFKKDTTGNDGRYSRWSTPGANVPFRVPSYRGVLVQCERQSTAQTPNDRRVGAELFMTQAGGTIITNDNRATLYKRQGTFVGSDKIQTPRQTDLSGTILGDQYWIWTTNDDTPTFSFQMEVPFLLQDPMYTNDTKRCPSGPLLQQARTDLPRVCDGQEPGAYSVSCLMDLFMRAGGTATGKLYPSDTMKDPSDITKDPSVTTRTALLKDAAGKNRTLEEIRAYLDGLYSIATRAVDLAGKRIDDPKDINDAAMKMFGITLLGPCDSLERSENTFTVKRSSTGPFSAKCLDYIYRNAPNDSDNNLDPSLPYTPIRDHYSGLLNSEGTSTLRKDYPFRTCQAKGALAPIHPNGLSNEEAIKRANYADYDKSGKLTGPRTYDQVRAFYNATYQAANANSTSTNVLDIAAQKKAIMDCYGIEKKEYTTDCRGVTGQYIRLLPSAQRFGLPVAASGCEAAPAGLQLAKLQVFDAENKDLTTDLPPVRYTAQLKVSSAAIIKTNYVDVSGSDYKPLTSPLTSYWMVDLSDVKNVSRVVYTGLTTCPERAQGMIVQLLDASKNVVLQKTLTGATRGPETLLFLADDLRPPIPFAATSGSQGTGLIANIRVRLESAVQPGMFIGRDTPFVQPPQTIANTRLKLRPASDRDTTALQLDTTSAPLGTFRLKLPGTSAAQDAFVWVHGMDCRLASKPTTDAEGASLFENWSAWVLKPAINGAYAYANIESATNPGWYLVPTRISAATNSAPQYQVDILNITANSTDFDKFRICWKIYPA